MENLSVYTLNEIVALITSVIIGTGAYIGFSIIKKQESIRVSTIFWIFMINIFITYLASELLRILNKGEYRTLILPLVAYSGQYLIEWFDKRYLKIFDTGVKKVGLDIEEKEEDYEKE